jgi:hypothetical protein
MIKKTALNLLLETDIALDGWNGKGKKMGNRGFLILTTVPTSGFQLQGSFFVTTIFLLFQQTVYLFLFHELFGYILHIPARKASFQRVL